MTGPGGSRLAVTIFRDVTRERRAEEERDRVVHELEMERSRLTALVEQLRTSRDLPSLADAPPPGR